MSGSAFGQVVTGQLKKLNGDTLKLTDVYIYADTTSGPPAFQSTVKKTDTTGVYVFTMPNNVPINTLFYVSTLDCDSQSYVINALTWTGSNMTSNLTICVAPSTKFSGYVYLGNVSKRPQTKDAQVYLISKCSGNLLTYIDSVETDTNGYYSFNAFPTLSTGCELVMRAALKNTSSEYKQFLPAYHESNTSYALKWSGGREIPVNVAKAGINIILPQAINPNGGPSSISGYAKDGSNNRLEHEVMLITDMNDVTVDYTHTDNNGAYAFSNLPFGSYKVFGDVWGRDNIDFIATVDADHVHILNLIFLNDGTTYKGSIATSVAGRNGLVKTISIYPNPAKDNIYIKGAEDIRGEKQVILTDITGATVYQSNFAEKVSVTVPVGSLTSGVYLLKLSTATETAVFRVAK